MSVKTEDMLEAAVNETTLKTTESIHLQNIPCFTSNAEVIWKTVGFFFFKKAEKPQLIVSFLE